MKKGHGRYFKEDKCTDKYPHYLTGMSFNQLGHTTIASFRHILSMNYLWDSSKSAWHHASAGGVHRTHGTSKQRSTLKRSQQKGSWDLAENGGRGGRVFQAGGVRSSASALLWLLRDSDINPAAPRRIGSLLPLRRREEVGRLPVWPMSRREGSVRALVQ